MICWLIKLTKTIQRHYIIVADENITEADQKCDKNINILLKYNGIWLKFK